MGFKLVVIGCLGGIASGFFGIGGGIVLIPALVLWLGFSQARATGTSLAVLLPPIGLAAAVEYYRHGNVDVTAAAILAGTMIPASWLAAHVANRLKMPYLQLAFGVFVCGVGAYVTYNALRRLGWS
ncbi:MAG: sulfite exporter TauE/SafE family protein [Deltaproteobacteria bacterium]|nr:sulfite exporter TauE/SafE family protein [Deltaproteobacteria bacterium]